MKVIFLFLAWFPLLLTAQLRADSSASVYQKWSRGPSTDPNFFPIGVYLQEPANAEKYKQAGINTYVGLWDGPTEEKLAALKRVGMKLTCEQTEVALKHLDDPTIIAWMHDDEPDNAQELPGKKGYGPPILPQKIADIYDVMVKADPTRPVMLNLGQSVAFNEWNGRGTRTGHAEDYPEYLKGADIVSFDIYPVVHDDPVVKGKLWFVAQGVDHLVKIGKGEKVVWNCLECTHISDPNAKATPRQVRAEAWMSLIHGSQGLIYFVHQFAPKFNEAALLGDPEMLAAVTAINKQITELAPILNSPNIITPFHGSAMDPKSQIDWVLKRDAHSTYLFAVEMRGVETKGIFGGPFLSSKTVSVIGENRTIQTTPSDPGESSFTDTFAPWDVHLYQVKD